MLHSQLSAAKEKEKQSQSTDEIRTLALKESDTKLKEILLQLDQSDRAKSALSTEILTLKEKLTNSQE